MGTLTAIINHAELSHTQMKYIKELNTITYFDSYVE